MPAALPYSKHTPGRTFIVAICVLGIVALTQIGAIGWAFVKRASHPPVIAVASAPALSPPKMRNSSAPGEEKETLMLGDPFDEKDQSLAANGDTPETTADPIMPPDKPQPIPQARLQPAPDSRLAETLQQARTLRDRGDMSNALVRFREAYALDPHNPEPIAEMAVTFGKMGLPDKAAENWKRVFDMGESAGVYFAAAEAKMKEAMMATRVAVQDQGDPNAQVGGGNVATATFGVGAVESVDINDAKAMKRFALRVPVQLRLKTKINVKDIEIHVLFYDLLNDKLIRTNANITKRWTTAPTDWRDDDTEILEVEYLQPAPDPRDPKRENRKYFGYIVRVYYKDELQATRAEPPILGQKFPASQTLEKENAQ